MYPTVRNRMLQGSYPALPCPLKTLHSPKKAFQNLASAASLPHLVCSTLWHFLACVIVFFVSEVIANLEKSCKKSTNNIHIAFMQIHLLTFHCICFIICACKYVLFPSSYPFLSTSPIDTHTQVITIIGTFFFFLAIPCGLRDLLSSPSRN